MIQYYLNAYSTNFHPSEYSLAGRFCDFIEYLSWQPLSSYRNFGNQNYIVIMCTYFLHQFAPRFLNRINISLCLRSRYQCFPEILNVNFVRRKPIVVRFVAFLISDHPVVILSKLRRTAKINVWGFKNCWSSADRIPVYFFFLPFFLSVFLNN